MPLGNSSRKGLEEPDQLKKHPFCTVFFLRLYFYLCSQAPLSLVSPSVWISLVKIFLFQVLEKKGHKGGC